MSAQQELKACSGWNLHAARLKGASPHRECDDIWVRYQKSATRTDGSFECDWYDVAEELPSIQALCQSVASLVESKDMGGVLVTRIPAGKQVYPHVDLGWHACHYDKYAVQIHGNAAQAFCFEDDSLSALVGDLYQFSNQSKHWVVNPSDEDRVTLIVCLRTH